MLTPTITKKKKKTTIKENNLSTLNYATKHNNFLHLSLVIKKKNFMKENSLKILIFWEIKNCFKKNFL